MMSRVTVFVSCLALGCWGLAGCTGEDAPSVGTTPVAAFVNAVQEGDAGELTILMERHSPVGIVDEEGRPLVYIAAAYGHVEVLSMLLAAGCDPNAIAWNNRYPLDGAVLVRQPEAVRLLLQHGADPNGHLALVYAANLQEAEICRMLLDAGADPNRASGRGYTALSDAVMRRNDEIVELLMAGGADPHFQDEDGASPLQKAQRRLDDFSEIATILQKAIDTRP